MLTLKNFNRKLSPITNLTATAGNQQITLKWTDPVDTGSTTRASTKLVRKTGSAPTTSSDGTLVLTETTRNQYSSTGYVNTGLTSGTTYYYKAFSVDNNGNETPSNSVNATPEAPGVNEYTENEYTSSVMQEWLSDYPGDTEALETLLGSDLADKINYEIRQAQTVVIPWGPTDPIGTITRVGGGIISSTSSPQISGEENPQYFLCFPVDPNGNIIFNEDIQYLCNEEYDWEYISLQKYVEWHNLGAVAVDILGTNVY